MIEVQTELLNIPGYIPRNQREAFTGETQQFCRVYIRGEQMQTILNASIFTNLFSNKFDYLPWTTWSKLIEFWILYFNYELEIIKVKKEFFKRKILVLNQGDN